MRVSTETLIRAAISPKIALCLKPPVLAKRLWRFTGKIQGNFPTTGPGNPTIHAAQPVLSEGTRC